MRGVVGGSPVWNPLMRMGSRLPTGLIGGRGHEEPEVQEMFAECGVGSVYLSPASPFQDSPEQSWP